MASLIALLAASVSTLTLLCYAALVLATGMTGIYLAKLLPLACVLSALTMGKTLAVVLAENRRPASGARTA